MKSYGHFKKQLFLPNELWNSSGDSETHALTKQHHLQARSQISKFGEAKYIFRGARFLFLSYFENKFFWEQENVGGH